MCHWCLLTFIYIPAVQCCCYCLNFCTFLYITVAAPLFIFPFSSIDVHSTSWWDWNRKSQVVFLSQINCVMSSLPIFAMCFLFTLTIELMSQCPILLFYWKSLGQVCLTVHVLNFFTYNHCGMSLLHVSILFMFTHYHCGMSLLHVPILFLFTYYHCNMFLSHVPILVLFTCMFPLLAISVYSLSHWKWFPKLSNIVGIIVSTVSFLCSLDIIRHLWAASPMMSPSLWTRGLK